MLTFLKATDFQAIARKIIEPMTYLKRKLTAYRAIRGVLLSDF
jgi:hypothetical protein